MEYLRKLRGEKPRVQHPGEKLYEMACLTCHQPGGKGLPGVYPPLAGSQRVRAADGSPLIKIVLHGLSGGLTVAGQAAGTNPDSVPMPPLGGLTDQQIADVLSFVRSAYGQDAGPVSAAEVEATRAATAGREKPWTAGELSKE